VSRYLERVERSGEKWREVERSGEKWGEVERSGEKWRREQREREQRTECKRRSVRCYNTAFQTVQLVFH